MVGSLLQISFEPASWELVPNCPMKQVLQTVRASDLWGSLRFLKVREQGHQE